MSPIDGNDTIKRMYSVNDLAKHYDISPNTLKNWASEFRDYLGDGANANPRFYVENDLQALNLVSHLRQQNKPYTEIHKALEQGDRMEATPVNASAIPPDNDTPNNELMTKLTATVARFEGELTATKQERDRLISQVENERNRANDLLERAIKAETEAQQITPLQQRIETEAEARTRAEAEAKEAVERATRAETTADMLRAQLDEMSQQDAPTSPSEDASDSAGTNEPTSRRWWHIFGNSK